MASRDPLRRVRYLPYPVRFPAGDFLSDARLTANPAFLSQAEINQKATPSSSILPLVYSVYYGLTPGEVGLVFIAILVACLLGGVVYAP
ncbi:hypothetical protein F4678DRAFT_458479 [Xylaria arbuscula]|nr:hypothetical protein F4678DRAFT_458479 [Xylaria arbuscula]